MVSGRVIGIANVAWGEFDSTLSGIALYGAGKAFESNQTALGIGLGFASLIGACIGYDRIMGGREYLGIRKYYPK